jgi:hypothetical protein
LRASDGTDIAARSTRAAKILHLLLRSGAKTELSGSRLELFPHLSFEHSANLLRTIRPRRDAVQQTSAPVFARPA